MTNSVVAFHELSFISDLLCCRSVCKLDQFTVFLSEAAQCLRTKHQRKDTKAAQCRVLVDESQRSEGEGLIQERAKHLKSAISLNPFTKLCYVLFFYVAFSFMYPICLGPQQQ